LAKLTYAGDREGLQYDEARSHDAMTAVAYDLRLSLTCVAIGTVPYMSPEQVRGEKLDARTDLFSFGVVLYEMATGQQAFSGDTAAELHHAILNLTPVSGRDLSPELPPRVEEIINKALQKDRNLRYQGAAEMRADLQRLKRGTDSSRQVPTVSAEPAASTPTAAQPAHTSSSSTLVAAARQHKLGIGITSVIVILLVAAAAYAIYVLLSRTRPVPFQDFSVNKIKETGKATLVAISPDGKYISATATTNETSVLAPLPAPGESLDDSPNPPKSQAQVRVLTVEVG
jgi:serine/threonine protein kinase